MEKSDLDILTNQSKVWDIAGIFNSRRDACEIQERNRWRQTEMFVNFSFPILASRGIHTQAVFDLAVTGAVYKCACFIINNHTTKFQCCCTCIYRLKSKKLKIKLGKWVNGFTEMERRAIREEFWGWEDKHPPQKKHSSVWAVTLETLQRAHTHARSYRHILQPSRCLSRL